MRWLYNENSGVAYSETMNNICSKCGAETRHDGDLHCREIFINEIKKLLALNEFEKAKTLYFFEFFDESWKEVILFKLGGNFARLIREEWQKRDAERSAAQEELQKKDAEGRHIEYIKSLGARYMGTSPISMTKKHRAARCYECRESLDNFIHFECNRCQWIVCKCGACGCGYIRY